MKCIYCGGNTQVTNSRPQKKTNSTWRRRECQQCGNIFTTHESADFSGSWLFLAKDGSLQPFVQEKLLISLYDSLRHRESALADAAALLNTILGKLLHHVNQATITREQIITECARTLHNFDEPAAISYEAFHKM